MLILTKIREQRLLSAKFISQLVGLTVSEYKSYENDRTGDLLKHDPELLNKLAKILGVDENDLFQKQQNQPISNVLARTYSEGITEHDKKLISSLAVFRDKISEL
jgi:transcriptional regulator with XRE-family HTH domain